jgi:FKBP-type peptidyl-prolyl cis-trans isomerase FklB
MKNTTHRMIRRAAAGAVLVAYAPLILAQNTSSPPVSAAPQGQGAQSPQGAPTPPPSPALSNDQASYLFGLTLGEQWHSIGIPDIQIDAVSRGVKDAMAGKKSTPADRQQLNEFARAAVQAAGIRNKTAAQEFLAKKGKEKGVQTTASGLEYKVIKAGDSKTPLISATDEVTVNYRGKLIDGTEFDSSYTHGQPATFPANGVIKGWQEALVLMRPGAHWELYIPPELAYGPAPRPNIPPNSALVFDVEVVSAKAKPAAVQAPTPGAPGGMMGAPGNAAPKPSTPQ